jgi:hypothetical protein
MAIKCAHLITNNTKIVKQGVEGQQSNFLCSLKRISREDSKVINDAYQKQTRVSVAGYTCYYHDSSLVKPKDCPKYEGDK